MSKILRISLVFLMAGLATGAYHWALHTFPVRIDEKLEFDNNLHLAMDVTMVGLLVASFGLLYFSKINHEERILLKS